MTRQRELFRGMGPVTARFVAVFAAALACGVVAMGQTVVSPCGSDSQLPNTTLTSGVTNDYATNYISAGSGFVVNSTSSNSASVTFQTGTAICLGPGFHALGGTAATTFHALIAVPMVVSPTSMTAPAAGGAVGTISLTTSPSTLSWTANSDASWLGIGATTGTGSGSMVVVAGPNGVAGARIAHVRVYAGGVLLTQVTVSQAAQALLTSPSTMSVGANGTPGTAISVSTASPSDSWTASSSQTWADVISGSSGTGNALVTVGVTANGTTSSRTATITVTDGTTSAGVTITQNGQVLLLAPTSWNAAHGAGSTTVALSAASGMGWTAASDSSWLTVNSGSTASGTGSASLTVAATASSVVGRRSGTITVTGGGVTVDISVQQAGTTFTVSTSPSSLTSPALSAGGSSPTISVTTSATWTASADSWVSLSPASGTGSATVTATAGANSGAARTGSVSFISGGATIATVNVQQAAGTSAPPVSGVSAREYIRLGSRIIAVRAVNTDGPPTDSGSIPTQPNSTTGLGGVYQFKATDPVDASYITYFQPFLSPGYSSSPITLNSCHMFWYAAAQRLYLDDLDDNYQYTGNTALGTGGIDLSNGICTIHGSSSSVSTAGGTLTLTLSIDLSPQPTTVTYYPYASVTNNTTTTGWSYLGSSSTINALSTSTVSFWGGVVNSPNTSGYGAVIRFAAEDPVAAANITYLMGYLSTGYGPTSTGCAFYTYRDSGVPKMLLSAGSSGAWGTTSIIGSGGIDLPHSGDPAVPLCVVHAGNASSSAYDSGNSQVVNLDVDVATGNTYYLYGYALSSDAGAHGWTLIGWFTVP